jgi:hypothetical protein
MKHCFGASAMAKLREDAVLKERLRSHEHHREPTGRVNVRPMTHHLWMVLNQGTCSPA